MGGWVDEETGTAPDGTPYTLPIDDAAELIGSDIEGPIAGALDLSARLAQSAQVQQCLSSRLWQAALGRQPTVREATSLASVQLRLAETGSLREALLTVVQSTGFTYIRRPR
jgi:hypothetical protein